MSDDVEGACETTRAVRLHRKMLLSMVLMVLAGTLSFPAVASASAINLNGQAPGIQSVSSFPNYAAWVNTPTELSVVPQGAKTGPLPGQVVNTTTTYKTVTQPVYGQVAHQGQTWVNSGYWATGWYWANTGYWATGWYWANTGYWATGWYWANTGYWATGWNYVRSGYWHTYWFRNCYAAGPYRVPVCNWYWGRTWVNTSHWQSYNYWVNTSHWQSYNYWVNTSHWQSYNYWVNTSHWQPYTYNVNQIVGYRTIQVPVVTTVAQSNINVSNESLLGVWTEVQNTSNGQRIYGEFCNTPTTPLIPPTSPNFPNYSGSPWDYSNFFGSQGICYINASAEDSGLFDSWAVAQQSVQLIITPGWRATVTFNQVTTVNGVVTSSSPVTQTQTITGPAITGPVIPTRYLVGVACAVQNGRSYCPNGPAGGTPNP